MLHSTIYMFLLFLIVASIAAGVVSEKKAEKRDQTLTRAKTRTRGSAASHLSLIWSNPARLRNLPRPRAIVRTRPEIARLAKRNRS